MRLIILFKTYVCLIIIILMYSCAKEIQFDNIDNNENIELKGGYNDGYFDWDRINEITFLNEYNKPKTISLPWMPGSSNTCIPIEWLDDSGNVFNNDYSKRRYSRENGWIMVYSNMNLKGQLGKYFALYHKPTGVLRFFFYTSDTNVVANNLAMVININTLSKLFNFTGVYAEALDITPDRPMISFSPSWTLDGKTFDNTGYQKNYWYGFEVECAYDPDITADTKFNITLNTAKITVTTGTALTKGSIEGTITSKSAGKSTPSLSFDLSKDKTSFTQNNSSSMTSISETVQDGVNKNNSFFKNLWGQVRGNAGKWLGEGISAGVKEGVKAIFSSGSSLALSAANALFSSLIGGGSENISKVELELNSKTTIELSSVEKLPGMGPISLIPVPGADKNSDDPPLYNEQLGIWNINETPIVGVYGKYIAGVDESPYHYYDFHEVNLSFELINNIQLRLNPVYANEYNVKNYSVKVFIYRFPDNFGNWFDPISTVTGKNKEYALINEKGCIAAEDNKTSINIRTINQYPGTEYENPDQGMDKIAVVQVSFILQSKMDPNKSYSYSKLFKPKGVLIKTGISRDYPYVWND